MVGPVHHNLQTVQRGLTHRSTATARLVTFRPSRAQPSGARYLERWDGPTATAMRSPPLLDLAVSSGSDAVRPIHHPISCLCPGRIQAAIETGLR